VTLEQPGQDAIFAAFDHPGAYYPVEKLAEWRDKFSDAALTQFCFYGIAAVRYRDRDATPRAASHRPWTGRTGLHCRAAVLLTRARQDEANAR